MKQFTPKAELGKITISECPIMSFTITRRRMFSGVFLCSVCLVAATIFVTGGCGDTNDDRRQISQHTKDLAAKVKAAPESSEGKAAMKELIDILNGNWSFARCQVCYVFDELGPLAAPAVPDLMRAAQSADGFVEQDAIRGLRSIGPAAAPAVDLLIGIVASATSSPAKTAGLRELYAVQALGNIGEPALKATPILEAAKQLTNELVVKEAQKSLDKLKRVADAQSKEKRPAE
jgi:hypothetical protein